MPNRYVASISSGPSSRPSNKVPTAAGPPVPNPALSAIRRRALILLAAFVGLLAFHLWLLSRTVASRNVLLSSLLVIAISVFVWRIVHYTRRVRSSEVAPASLPLGAERKKIQLYALILVALLGLHAWLISVTWSAGEYLFVFLLFGAVAVFTVRLAMYGRRWLALRRVAPERSLP